MPKKEVRMAGEALNLSVISNYFMLLPHKFSHCKMILQTQANRLNVMKKGPRDSKTPPRIRPSQGTSGMKALPILDTFKTMTLSAQVPPETDQASLERLIHDIRSAANAFSFLVDQLASDPASSGNDRHLRKLNQLRQHDAVNKICMDAIIGCLRKQII